MTSHYFSEEQDSPLELRKLKVTLLGNDLEFYTSGGVFSKNEIDNGTYVLIINAKLSNGQKVLDLGCGYGAVGVSLAKAFDIDLVMTDINKRAVMLSKKNIRLNNVEAEVLQGDSYSKVEGEFDVILLNPPQHAGKKLCFEMISNSINYLKKGGSLQMVARHKKGGKHLSEKMEEVFGNVDVLGKKSGFRVYISVKQQ